MNKLKLAACIALIGCNVAAFTFNQNFERALEATFEKRNNAVVLREYIEKIKAIEKSFPTDAYAQANAQKILEPQKKVTGTTVEDTATSVTNAGQNELYALVQNNKILMIIEERTKATQKKFLINPHAQAAAHGGTVVSKLTATCMIGAIRDVSNDRLERIKKIAQEALAEVGHDPELKAQLNATRKQAEKNIQTMTINLCMKIESNYNKFDMEQIFKSITHRQEL